MQTLEWSLDAFFVISLSHVHIFNLVFGNKQNYNIDVVFVYSGVEWVMSG